MQYMPSFMREKYEEGREEGLEDGREQGQALFFIKLLKEKFNGIPDWAIQRIEEAKPEMLDQWASNFLKKGTIDEVLS